MSKEEKIQILLSLLSKSDCIFINDIPCFFNEYYTYAKIENGIPEFISIDDYEKDDNYISFFTKFISDIEFNKNKIVIYYKNRNYIVKILKYIDIEFND